jgi:pimeloyl-ACP methyl ester carboxylesterase
MYKSQPRIPADYVVPLNINGLRGRLLRIPPKKSSKREILVVYGHHSSLERYYSFAEVMNQFGGVTMPDLPGFGGMDSFYKVGEKPDIDTMADYLATIVKLRFKNKKIIFAGISYGFTVITRMLQRYPDIAKKSEFVFSIAGFAHKDDLRFTRRRIFMYKTLARIVSVPPVAAFFRNVCLHPAVLRLVYHRMHNAKHKFEGYEGEEKRAMTEFEIILWRNNDVRTYSETAITMMTLDNCNVRVNLPVHHIGVETDNYFDINLVEQHMRVIFSDFTLHRANLAKHVPNILADKREAAKMIPASVKKLFKS